MRDDDDYPTKPDDVRKAMLAQFRAKAKAVFAEKPELSSIVLAVAQYWADEADDAVHCSMYGSKRSIPLWPHTCEHGGDPTEGEVCSDCGRVGDCYPDDWDDNGTSIQAFEAYCHESGSQEEPPSHNDMPYAIARRVGDDVVVEVIGDIQRPGSIDGGYDPADYDPEEPIERDTTWDDPRARELLALVAATPADDGPRRVLADYLMERENPRGDYIALALDGTDHARRDALLAEHEARWLHPLEGVLIPSTVRWSRGFPVAADLYGSSDGVKGSPVWSTLERITIHTGDCVIDPAMRALRELGPIFGDHWLDGLLAENQPWAIEKLVIEIDDPRAYARLAEATNLPALRELVVIADEPDAIVASLPHARWWSQLQRLVVAVPELSLATWQQRRHEMKVPWFAVARHHTDPADAIGWEFAFDQRTTCEVTLHGFTPEASLEALRTLLPGVQAQTIRLVPSRYYEPSAVDLERLGDARLTV